MYINPQRPDYEQDYENKKRKRLHGRYLGHAAQHPLVGVIEYAKFLPYGIV